VLPGEIEHTVGHFSHCRRLYYPKEAGYERAVLSMRSVPFDLRDVLRPSSRGREVSFAISARESQPTE